METELTGQHRVFRARVDASGRIVLPSESRLRKEVREGDTILVEEDSKGLHLRTIEDAVREAQAYFRSVIPSNVSLIDELIAERREEAARE
jgi:AbrB family looped-hinge helix DNA binding protein